MYILLILHRLFNTMSLISGVFAFFLICSTPNSNGWKLEKDKNGIQVFTRLTKGRKIKEFKAVTRINASLASVVALVRDADAAHEWYNHVKSGEPLKIFNEKSSIVHLILDFPFPAADRDFVAKFDYSQDPNTKIVTSRVVGIPDYIPKKDSFIRIRHLEGSWTFTPLEEDLIEVEYQFYADPPRGGVSQFGL